MALSTCQQPLSFEHIQKKQKTDNLPSIHQYNIAIGYVFENVNKSFSSLINQLYP